MGLARRGDEKVEQINIMISVIELGNKFSCEFAYKVNCKVISNNLMIGLMRIGRPGFMPGRVVEERSKDQDKYPAALNGGGGRQYRTGFRW